MRSSRRLVFASLWLALTFSIGSVSAQDPEPTEPTPPEPLPELEVALAFGEPTDGAAEEDPPDEVAVTGVTPGGTVSLTYLNRTVDAFGARVFMGTELLVDDDEDGAVVFVPQGGIAKVSSWVVVDLSAGDGAGRVAQASPAGFTPKPRTLPDQALERGANGQLRRLHRDGQVFYTVLLRPGDETARGAWSLLLEDGGDADQDGRGNGKVVFQPESAEPIGTSPIAPMEFLGGDVLVMTHPRTFALTVLSLRKTGKPQDLTHRLLGIEPAAAASEGVR